MTSNKEIVPIEKTYNNIVSKLNLKLITAMDSNELRHNFVIHNFHIIDEVIYIKILNDMMNVFFNIKYDIQEQNLNIVKFIKDISKIDNKKHNKNHNKIKSTTEIILDVRNWCNNIIYMLPELKNMVILRDKILIEKIHFYIKNGLDTMKEMCGMSSNNPENMIFEDNLQITLLEYKTLDDVKIHLENENFEIAMRTFGIVQLYPKFGYFYRIKKEHTGFRKFNNKYSEKLMNLIALHII